MQLVEDFETDAVARFAGFGICDGHGVGGLLEHGEVRFGDHLVGYCLDVRIEAVGGGWWGERMV